MEIIKGINELIKAQIYETVQNMSLTGILMESETTIKNRKRKGLLLRYPKETGKLQE